MPISSNKETNPNGRVQASTKVVIQSKQFAGTQTLYIVKSATGEEITIATPSHQDYEVGSTISINPQFEHIITF